VSRAVAKRVVELLSYRRTLRARHHHRQLGRQTPGGLTSDSGYVTTHQTPRLGDLRSPTHDLESWVGADMLSLSKNFSRQSDELVPDGLST
jgi:hypothetical protein